MSITDNLKKISEQEWAQDPDNLVVINDWNERMNRIAELKDYASLTETKRIVSHLKAQIEDINKELDGLDYIDDKDAVNAKLSLRKAYKGLLKQFFSDKDLDEEFKALETEIESEILKNNL